MFQSNYRKRVNRYISIILPLLGFFIIILMLGLVWFWETNGRELYFYDEVVVFNRDITKGTIITEDMLSYEKFEANKIIDNAIDEKNTITGLEAKHFIPMKTQLHPYYFESPELTTDKDRYIVRIPNDWLYSVPNTLRRKDEIIIYSLNLNQEEEDKNRNLEDEDKKLETEIDTYNANEVEEIKNKLTNPIMKTKVAYVKDSANREVQTIGFQARMNGTSVIAEVLILVTTEEFQLLEEVINKGGKLIIMHSEGEN